MPRLFCVRAYVETCGAYYHIITRDEVNEAHCRYWSWEGNVFHLFFVAHSRLFWSYLSYLKLFWIMMDNKLLDEINSIQELIDCKHLHFIIFELPPSNSFFKWPKQKKNAGVEWNLESVGFVSCTNVDSKFFSAVVASSTLCAFHAKKSMSKMYRRSKKTVARACKPRVRVLAFTGTTSSPRCSWRSHWNWTTFFS